MLQELMCISHRVIGRGLTYGRLGQDRRLQTILPDKERTLGHVVLV